MTKKKARLTIDVEIDRCIFPQNSELSAAGVVTGRLHFVYEDEKYTGIIVDSLCADADQMTVEVPNLGIVAVKSGDLVHQMMHLLCETSHEFCEGNYRVFNGD